MVTLPHVPAPVRSQRFAVDVPLQFRSPEDEQWWPAHTENISATGILFRSAKTIPPLTPIELKFQLGVGDGRVVMKCSGMVARVVDMQAVSEEACVGVSVANFDLFHAPVKEIKQAEAGDDISSLFHRLNTLLFIIMGNAEVVSAKTSNEALHATAGTHILNAADEATTIVRSLAAKMKQRP